MTVTEEVANPNFSLKSSKGSFSDRGLGGTIISSLWRENVFSKVKSRLQRFLGFFLKGIEVS